MWTSGHSLPDKLRAAAGAGFVEIDFFEPDWLAHLQYVKYAFHITSTSLSLIGRLRSLGLCSYTDDELTRQIPNDWRPAYNLNPEGVSYFVYSKPTSILTYNH